RSDRDLEDTESRGVTAWPRKALHQSEADGISNGDENQRDRLGLAPQRDQPGRSTNKDDFRLQIEQLFRGHPRAFGVARVPAKFASQGTPLDPAELLQAVMQGSYALLV